jgi:hypothetical protein
MVNSSRIGQSLGERNKLGRAHVERCRDGLDAAERWVQLRPLDLPYVVAVEASPMAKFLLRDAPLLAETAHGAPETDM